MRTETHITIRLVLNLVHLGLATIVVELYALIEVNLTTHGLLMDLRRLLVYLRLKRAFLFKFRFILLEQLDLVRLDATLE